MRKKPQIGQYVLVKWDDVGVQESLVVEVDTHTTPGGRRYKRFRVFDGCKTHWADSDQIKGVGKHHNFIDSGF